MNGGGASVEKKHAEIIRGARTMKIETELQVITCSAGHIYAVPNLVNSYFFSCPFCQMQAIAEMRDEIETLKKTISGYKGYLKERGR